LAVVGRGYLTGLTERVLLLAVMAWAVAIGLTLAAEPDGVRAPSTARQ
jgi:hypothetical protein